MTDTAALKLNTPTIKTFSRLKLEWTGKKRRGELINSSFDFGAERKRLTSRMLVILSDISAGNAGRDLPRYMPHKYFIKKFGMCKKTVQSSLDFLIKHGIIEKCGRGRYRVIIDDFSESYMLIEDYIFGHSWEVEGETTITLTFSDIIVLEYICSMYELNNKQGKPFVRSQNKLGAGINFAGTTVSDSIQKLVKAKLVYRYRATPKNGYADDIEDTEYDVDYEHEGVVGEGYSLTAYVPAARLLEVRQELFGDQDKTPAAEQKAPIERKKSIIKLPKKSKQRKEIIDVVMGNLLAHKTEVEAEAQKVKQILFNDEVYGPLVKEYRQNKLDIDIAYKQLDIEKVRLLSERQNEIQKIQWARIKELGIPGGSWEPRYHCKKCKDTGQIAVKGRGKPKYCTCFIEKLAEKGWKL